MLSIYLDELFIYWREALTALSITIVIVGGLVCICIISPSEAKARINDTHLTYIVRDTLFISEPLAEEDSCNLRVLRKYWTIKTFDINP